MSEIKKYLGKIKSSLFNRFLKTGIERIVYLETKNIQGWLQQKALETTGKFVEQHLQNIPSFKTKYGVLDLALKNISNNSGYYFEFGVFSGTTINYVAERSPKCTLYGFDSFEGLPESWNSLDKGHFKVAKLPKVKKNVTLVKGWFNESIPVFKKSHTIDFISYLHIDSDLYSSAKTIFDELGDAIKSGTVIVFDEYFNYPDWEQGEYKAFNEFISKRNLKFQFLGYCFMGEQLAVKII